MKPFIFILSIGCFLLTLKDVKAQYIPYHSYSSTDLTLSARGGEFLGTASLNNLSSGQIKIGFALRLNTFLGSKKRYITAPAILTSGKTGPGVFFADQVKENIDTIFFEKSGNASVNVALILEYSFSKNWAAGFNIDLFGISIGGRQKGTYQDWNGQTVTARATPFNVLLISDNDIGNLNSEFYAKYFFTDKPYFVKAGASFYFNEMKTLQKQRLDNSRFRYKTLSPMIGGGYLLKNHFIF